MKRDNPFHSGFITIIGRPNVGKSSLMNALIGEKIAIVSARPQTTRNRIMGVITQENNQMVFLDTPGIHDPKTQLGEYMMRAVNDALDSVDIIVVMSDVSHVTEKDMEIAGNMAKNRIPIVLVLNKTDLVTPAAVLEITARFADKGFEEILPVSVLKKEGLDELKKCLLSHLPEGPRYFPDDMMTDQPERMICAEIIREKALRNLRDEVPHGIGVEMMKIEEINENLTEMHATLYCEREGHKGIIIGHNGSMLQKIGSEARNDIEHLLNTHVNLKLWVKCRPDWRNNLSDLKNLGYSNKA